jgi:hypothetical protein
MSVETYPGCRCCGCCLPCNGYRYEKYQLVVTCVDGPCVDDPCNTVIGTYVLSAVDAACCTYKTDDGLWVFKWDGGGFFNYFRLGWNSWDCETSTCCTDQWLYNNPWGRVYVPSCHGGETYGGIAELQMSVFGGCLYGCHYGVKVTPIGAVIATCGCVGDCLEDINTAITNGTLTITTDHGGSASLTTLTVPASEPVCSGPVVTSLGTWLFFVVMPFWDYADGCFDDETGYGVGTCNCGTGFFSNDCTNTYYNNGWDARSGDCQTEWTMRIWRISDGTLAGTITITLGGY